MAIYVPLNNIPLQVMDVNGDPLDSGTLEFFLAGTSTPTNLFSNSSGTSVGTSITLNSSGYPESGGNVITLFRDTSINYKIVCKNSGGSTLWTSDTLNSSLDVLASVSNGEGASLVGVEDSAANFTGTDVEAVLAEIQASIDALSQSGTFEAGVTGLTTSPTGTCRYDISGSHCTLTLEDPLTGTSNSTALAITSIPAACQPVNAKNVPCVALTDNGSQHLSGYAICFSSAFSFALTGGSAFTGSGGKGIQAQWSITYSLD